MAPFVLDLLPDVRSAETPKDLSRWYSKREVLHDIYILQGKSLSDVKKIMESDHGFSKTLKPSDYEHVLREEFKFRKNLSADEWRLSIGPLIAKRKAEGKRSEVLLNGSKVRNVDRRIERSFKSKRSRRFATAHAAAMPYGLVIRTPSPRPSTLVTCPNFSKSAGESPVEDAGRYQSHMKSPADSPDEAYWLSLLTGVIPVPESGPGVKSVFSAHLLRDGCPINKFLDLLDEYQHKFNHAALRLFGPNPTISKLGKLCFDLSNRLHEQTISRHEMRSILDWIGFSVDIAILSTFFSTKTFTTLAVWEALVSTTILWKHSAAFEVFLSVHLSAKDRLPWTTTKPFYYLSRCLAMVPNRAAAVINAYSFNQRQLDTALQVALSNMRRIPLAKQLISAGASCKNGNCKTSIDELVRYFASKKCEAVDLPLLEILLDAGAVVDQPSPYDREMDWSQPNTPTHSTDYILLNWGCSKNIECLWSLVSVYSDRQQTTITVPGILEAAQGGREHLSSYLYARSKPYDDQDRKRVLETSLSEASGKGHANVVQSLLQFGVDPNVRMLPRFNPATSSQNIWHPVIRAVNSGQFHTLRILVTQSSADIVFLEDIVDEQLDLFSLRNMENSQRSQIIKALSALDIPTAARSGITFCAIGPHNRGKRGHKAPDYGFVSQLLELGLACLDCRQYTEGEVSHILVRAIQKGCDVRALDYLIQQDVTIISGLSADTRRALLEATISQAGSERYEILAFLAQNIEGFRSCAQENVSSLLLCLFNHMHCHHSIGYLRVNYECCCESMITLRWFLDLGVPWEGRVLGKLFEHTDDHFMLAMIHSVADVSTITIDGCYALSSFIRRGRLNLAVALIERDPQVKDTRGQDGRTALQQACEGGAPLWFIRFLVDKGEDVNAPPNSNGGRTALQAACFNRAQLSCINFLIDKGADVNAPPAPYNGWTALQCAASRGLMNVAGLLLDRGADVNALSCVIDPGLKLRFMRALDLAAKYSRLEMAHFLIAAGARSSRPGCTGYKGAIEIARSERNFALASLVQEHAGSRCRASMEAERMWLRANSHTCIYNGKIQEATWVAFLKRAGGESKADVREYMKERFNVNLFRFEWRRQERPGQLSLVATTNREA